MGVYEKFLRSVSCDKDWGNKSKSAKKAMKRANKKSAQNKFIKDVSK